MFKALYNEVVRPFRMVKLKFIIIFFSLLIFCMIGEPVLNLLIDIIIK